jgi:hypothetical protein
LVQLRIAELRTELEASDPEEMRRRANAALSSILAKRLDTRYRRTALDILKRLDDQDRAKMNADSEAYRTVVAQMAALDAMENGRTNRARSTSSRLQAKEQTPAADIDQIIGYIEQLVAEQRHGRDPEPLPMPVLEARPDDPPKATSAVNLVKEQPVDQRLEPPTNAFQWVRKPGHFGRGGWVRVPNPR